MLKLINSINNFLYNDFLFAKEYRLWRHIIYWTVHTVFWALFWYVMNASDSFFREVINMTLWLPVFLLFSYPLVYYAIPDLLLKGMIWQFVLFILGWGLVGLFINAAFHTYLYPALQDVIDADQESQPGFQAYSYLSMTTSAASPMLIKFFKLWKMKQQEWLKAQNEKISAELQLLKSQVHPHFLFNTLNNIYAFSLNRSPKTPGMVLKLSAILSYMLYECKVEEVRLEKDLEAMKYYVELEKERLGNNVDISWNIEGDFKTTFIAPLLMLPFLENAFKYCSADHLQNPWLGVDVFIKGSRIHYKIVNSKAEGQVYQEEEGSVSNIKKRLDFIYPGRYELRMHDEGNFQVTSLVIELSKSRSNAKNTSNSEVYNIKA